MLLKKVLLEDFGLYAGKIEFDLVPRADRPKDKPIILFGGKNGAGKTTFLEALKLVLYGKRFLNDRLTKTEYETYLRSKIHSGIKSVLPLKAARIAIEFDYVALGELTTYYVERSWCVTLDGNNVEETLQIFVDGIPEENVTEEYWKGFIEGIIPERLAQLFFFDGEKIQEIASDDVGNRILADSIKSLLGLDVVEKLKADLTIYKNRELKEESIASDKKKWNLVEKEISNIKKNIELCLSEELPSIRTQLDGKLTEIRLRENQLHSEGNLFVTRRDSLKSKRNNLTSRVESLENAIREECEKSFPFSLCPTISELLQKQLVVEKNLERQSIIRDEIQTYKDEIFEAAQTLPQLNNETIGQIRKLIDDLAKPRIEIPPELKEAKKILGLAESASNHIQATLQYAKNDSKKKVSKLSLELQDITQQLRDVTVEIGKIPEKEQIKPIFQELAILNQESGALQQKETLLLKKINNYRDSLKYNQKEFERLIERQTSQSRLGLVDKVQQVLDDYLKKLTLCKVEQLKKSVAEAFNSLSRKGNMIDKVEIDPNSFAVTLYDQEGGAIPKERLSSGEKQLYAVAMLWGLAKTSGRPLPVIVDTPLGRLDSDHRMNLVTNYFPEASHQVILLSTDTEVDQELYSELKPYVSHCYHLEYDSKTKSTSVTEEYFWAENSTWLN